MSSYTGQELFLAALRWRYSLPGSCVGASASRERAAPRPMCMHAPVPFVSNTCFLNRCRAHAGALSPVRTVRRGGATSHPRPVGPPGAAGEFPMPLGCSSHDVIVYHLKIAGRASPSVLSLDASPALEKSEGRSPQSFESFAGFKRHWGFHVGSLQCGPNLSSPIGCSAHCLLASTRCGLALCTWTARGARPWAWHPWPDLCCRSGCDGLLCRSNRAPGRGIPGGPAETCEARTPSLSSSSPGSRQLCCLLDQTQTGIAQGLHKLGGACAYRHPALQGAFDLAQALGIDGSHPATQGESLKPQGAGCHCCRLQVPACTGGGLAWRAGPCRLAAAAHCAL